MIQMTSVLIPNPAPNFNRLAQAYRWMEWLSFGPFLHRARTAFLPELATARHALILGDGDGRFTAALLRANPSVTIEAVDASPAMLSALVHRAGPHASRIQTHAADARAFQPHPTEPYDLVVTHFFLDCLTTDEVTALAARLRPHLASHGAPAARWLLSDFAIPPGLYGSLIARPLVAFLYLAFRLLTGLRIRRLPDHAVALQNAGFHLQAQKSQLFALLSSEIWQAERLRKC